MAKSKEDISTALPKQAKGGGAKFVFETLKSEILTLDLSPGAVLEETVLAQRFSMSRSPIREALVRLTAEGLAETLSNRSTLVAPINLAEFPRYVEALDVLQRINTRLAAKHRTAADIEQMLTQARNFDAACEADNHLLMSETNKDFHMAVAAGGKNPYFARSYGQLLDEGRRILHMHFDYLQMSETDHLLQSEHFEMIAAIEAQDVDLADSLAHEHSRQFHDRFANFMKAQYLDKLDLSSFGT